LLGETKVLLPGTTPLVAKLLTVAVAAWPLIPFEIVVAALLTPLEAAV
jgi:hypothetical protein